jgi:hypothetical protein
MISAQERRKLVYVMVNNAAAATTTTTTGSGASTTKVVAVSLASPLEAHRSRTLCLATVGVDHGYDNPGNSTTVGGTTCGAMGIFDGPIPILDQSLWSRGYRHSTTEIIGNNDYANNNVAPSWWWCDHAVADLTAETRKWIEQVYSKVFGLGGIRQDQSCHPVT